MKAASFGPSTIFSLGASGHHTTHAEETLPGRRVVGLVRRLRPVSMFTSEVFRRIQCRFQGKNAEAPLAH